jgi:type III secretion protein L
MDEKTLRLKAAEDAAAKPRLLKRDSYALVLEAHNIIEAARERAEALLREAEEQRQALLAQGREDGYREGLAQWNSAVAEASRRAAELGRDWEQDILKLSVAIARKIIGAELASRPETISSIVQEALKTLQRARRFTIQVNEADVEPVRARLDRLRQIVGSNREIDVVGSLDVAPGGCTVESDLGVIDARLDTQLRCMEDILTREARG